MRLQEELQRKSQLSCGYWWTGLAWGYRWKCFPQYWRPKLRAPWQGISLTQPHTLLIVRLGECLKRSFILSFNLPRPFVLFQNTFVGLTNLGATCYVNTFLQVWFHNLELRRSLYQCHNSRAEEHNAESGTTDNLFAFCCIRFKTRTYRQRSLFSLGFTLKVSDIQAFWPLCSLRKSNTETHTYTLDQVNWTSGLYEVCLVHLLFHDGIGNSEFFSTLIKNYLTAHLQNHMFVLFKWRKHFLVSNWRFRLFQSTSLSPSVSTCSIFLPSYRTATENTSTQQDWSKHWAWTPGSSR